MADRDNRLGKAKPLSGSPIVRNDSLGAADLDDLYRFTLSGKSSLDLGLSNVKKANFDVEVYSFKTPLNQIPKKTRDLDFRNLKAARNKYLQLVGASRKAGTAVENIKTELASGDYLVRVLRRKGDSKYRLNLTTTLVPPDGGGIGTDGNNPNILGNSIATAYSTFAIPTTTPIAGSVSNNDTQDYYKFTLAQNGTFTFNASNFQNNADLQFLDGGGNVIGTETLDSSNPQTFEKTLTAGTYYLRIFQEAPGDATIYSLTATSKPDIVDPTDPRRIDDDFNTKITSTLATTGSTTIQGQVDSGDTQDYVKLTVSQAGDYLFNLSGLAGNADVQFFNSSQQQIASTYKPDGTKFIQPLDQGDYYIKVYNRSGKTANYNLTASLQTDGVGNTAATAVDITANLSQTFATVKRNYVVDGGKKSPIDYYKFTVGATSIFTAELQGMFGNLDVRLINQADIGTDLNKQTPYSSKSNTSELVFPGGLTAGTYILQVFAPTGEGSTYELKASIEPTEGKPFMTADINNVGSSAAQNLVSLGNAAFFVAKNRDNETALYRTTGTADKLKRIRAFDSVGSSTLTTDNAFYFVANGGSGNELWQCTATGDVKAITNFTAATVSPGNMTAVGNYLYFTANEGTGNKLYRANVSSAQPTVDNSFASTLLGDTIASMTVASGALFFAGSNGQGQQLWRIKDAGTANAAAPEKITLNIGSGSAPGEITDVGNNTLYLVAERQTGTELVKLENILDAIDSNVNDSTGLKATNINLGANGIPEDLFLFKGGAGTSDDILYFVAEANDGALKGQELLKIENPIAATANPTVTLVKDINPGNGNSIPSDFVEFNNRLYFIANDGSGRKLWYTDATQGAISITQGLLDPANAGSGVPYSFKSSLTVVGNTLYLVANESSIGAELWQVDTSNKMSLVEDINILTTSPPATDSANPTQLTKVGGSLYFIASDGFNGSEVWTVTPVNG